MKKLIAALALTLAPLAHAETAVRNGVKLAKDASSSYTEFAGTREDHGLYGSIGFFSMDEGSKAGGLKLTIGPKLYDTGTLKGYLTYGFAAAQAWTPEAHTGYTMWHEAEYTMSYKIVGLGWGERWQNGKQYIEHKEGVEMNHKPFLKLYLQAEVN